MKIVDGEGAACDTTFGGLDYLLAGGEDMNVTVTSM